MSIMSKNGFKVVHLYVIVFVFLLFVAGFLGISFYFNDDQSQENNPLNPPQATGVGNLVTSLGCSEIGSDYFYRAPWPYNYLYITGSVSNTGKGTANNAGLHIIAFNSTGGLLVNMTVPLGNATFGTTPEINGYLKQNLNVNDSLSLERLQPGEIVAVDLGIVHEGVVSNWTINPVWTNTP